MKLYKVPERGIAASISRKLAGSNLTFWIPLTSTKYLFQKFETKTRKMILNSMGYLKEEYLQELHEGLLDPMDLYGVLGDTLLLGISQDEIYKIC